MTIYRHVITCSVKSRIGAAPDGADIDARARFSDAPAKSRPIKSRQAQLF